MYGLLFAKCEMPAVHWSDLLSLCSGLLAIPPEVETSQIYDASRMNRQGAYGTYVASAALAVVSGARGPAGAFVALAAPIACRVSAR